MVQVEYLVCGEPLKMPQYIDADNYDGQVRCEECRALLHIKLVQSKVRRYRVVNTNMVEPKITVVTSVPHPQEYPPEEVNKGGQSLKES